MAKGFTQQKGVDFFETFSLVAKMTTIRTLLALKISHHCQMHQLNVNNAVLHGDLHAKVYMEALEGYSVPPGMVLKLKKILYGLK